MNYEGEESEIVINVRRIRGNLIDIYDLSANLNNTMIYGYMTDNCKTIIKSSLNNYHGKDLFWEFEVGNEKDIFWKLIK